MREAALKNELRELLEKKEQQIEALQNKEKELQEMVNSLRESDASNKQELAIVTKEKVNQNSIHGDFTDCHSPPVEELRVPIGAANEERGRPARRLGTFASGKCKRASAEGHGGPVHLGKHRRRTRRFV